MSIIGTAGRPPFSDRYVINVRDHRIPGVGRVYGDGVTDDYPAMRAVFDYAQGLNAISTRTDLSLSVVIYIPRGHYLLSGTLVVYSHHVEIFGDGMDQTILQAVGPFPPLVCGQFDAEGAPNLVGSHHGRRGEDNRLPGCGKLGAPLTEVPADSPYSIFRHRPNAFNVLDGSAAPNTNSWWGYRTRSALIDCTFRVGMDRVPASGTFTVSLTSYYNDGTGAATRTYTSAPIAVSGGNPLTAARLQAALESLPNIGAGNMVVADVPANARGSFPWPVQYDCRFAGAMAGRNPWSSATKSVVGVNPLIFNTAPPSQAPLRDAGNVGVTAQQIAAQYANDDDYTGYWFLVGSPWDNGTSTDRDSNLWMRFQDAWTLDVCWCDSSYVPGDPNPPRIPVGQVFGAGRGFRLRYDANGAIVLDFQTADQDPITGPTAAGLSINTRQIRIFKSSQNRPSGGGTFASDPDTAKRNWRGLIRLSLMVDFTQSDPQQAFKVDISDHDYGTGTDGNRRPARALVDTGASTLGTWTPLSGSFASITPDYSNPSTNPRYATVILTTTAPHGLRRGTWISVAGVQSTPTTTPPGDEFWRLMYDSNPATNPNAKPILLQVLQVLDATSFRVQVNSSPGKILRLSIRGGQHVPNTGTWVQRHRMAKGTNRGLVIGSVDSAGIGPTGLGSGQPDITVFGLSFKRLLAYDPATARDGAQARHPSNPGTLNDLYRYQGSVQLRFPGSTDQGWFALFCQEPYLPASGVRGDHNIPPVRTYRWNARFPLAWSCGVLTNGMACNFNNKQSYNPSRMNTLRDLNLVTDSRGATTFYIGLYLNFQAYRVRFDARSQGCSFVRVPQGTNAYPMALVDCNFHASVFNIYHVYSTYNWFERCHFEIPAKVCVCLIGGSLVWKGSFFGAGLVERMFYYGSAENAGDVYVEGWQSNISESADAQAAPIFIESASYTQVPVTLRQLNLDRIRDLPVIEVDDVSTTANGVELDVAQLTAFGHSHVILHNGPKTTGLLKVSGTGRLPGDAFVATTGLYGSQSNIAVQETRAGVTDVRYANSTLPVTPSPL